jgi:hypothetical protein
VKSEWVRVDCFSRLVIVYFNRTKDTVYNVRFTGDLHYKAQRWLISQDSRATCIVRLECL